MKRTLRNALLAVAAVLPFLSAAAAAASIDAPERIAQHRLVACSTPDEGTGFGWFVVGPRGVEQVMDTVPDGHAIVFCGPPGKYSVMVSVFNGGSVSQGVASVEIVDGDDDSPVPTPTPAPTKVTHLYWVFESGDAATTVEQAMVRTAPAWRDAADQLGIRWLCDDKDVLVKEVPEIVEAARRTGLPQLAFVDVNGLVYLETPPATIDAAVALVKKYGGSTDASK